MSKYFQLLIFYYTITIQGCGNDLFEESKIPLKQNIDVGVFDDN